MAEDDPFGIAAYRARRGVRPQGGRKEGLATLLPGMYAAHVAKGLATLPERALRAAGELQRGGDYDPGPILEAAGLVMGGSAGAPKGAIGAGPTSPLPKKVDPETAKLLEEVAAAAKKWDDPKTPSKAEIWEWVVESAKKDYEKATQGLTPAGKAMVTLPKGPPEGVTPIKPATAPPPSYGDVYSQLPRDPSGLWQLSEKAKELGFTVPAIHGTRRAPQEIYEGRYTPLDWLEKDFGRFMLPEEEIGVHFGSPRAAQDILGGDISYGHPRKFPVVLRMKNPLDVQDIGSWGPYKMKNELERVGFNRREIQDVSPEYISNSEQIERLRKHIFGAGYDSLRYVNKVEDPGSISYVIMNPSQIRSPWAAFDPYKINYSDILSGLAGGAALAPAVIPRREGD